MSCDHVWEAFLRLVLANSSWRVWKTRDVDKSGVKFYFSANSLPTCLPTVAVYVFHTRQLEFTNYSYLFIYLFNFIYTRVKTSGLKGNTKITLIILSKYLSTTKLNLMTVKKKI